MLDARLPRTQFAVVNIVNLVLEKDTRVFRGLGKRKVSNCAVEIKDSHRERNDQEGMPEVLSCGGPFRQRVYEDRRDKASCKDVDRVFDSRSRAWIMRLHTSLTIYRLGVDIYSAHGRDWSCVFTGGESK